MSLAQNLAMPRVERACPLCGSPNRTLFAQRDAWDIVRCSDCGMVFLGRELTYEAQQAGHDWMAEYHKEGARRKEKHPVLVFLSRITRSFKPDTNRRLLGQTLKWAHAGKLIDFACGNGAFLEQAQHRFDASGIEMSPQAVADARRRVPAAKILEGPLT